MAYFPTSKTTPAILGASLNAKGRKLALAESCTGGLLAAAITSVPGSSAWFDRGFITYSNQAKVEMLGVLQQTLNSFGAVSEQTALEMATGALNHSLADIAGSITGIAGPDGGSVDKPVGTVCFAWACKDFSAESTTMHFDGSREEIRQQAANFMLAKLVERLS